MSLNNCLVMKFLASDLTVREQSCRRSRSLYECWVRSAWQGAEEHVWLECFRTECQRYWDRSESGVHAQMTIQQVNTKLLFPRNINIGISYCRLMLYYDSFRCGVADDPMCSLCATETETIEHFCCIVLCMQIKEKLFSRALTLSEPVMEHVVHGKELCNFFSDVPIFVWIVKNRTRANRLLLTS